MVTSCSHVLSPACQVPKPAPHQAETNDRSDHLPGLARLHEGPTAPGLRSAVKHPCVRAKTMQFCLPRDGLARENRLAAWYDCEQTPCCRGSAGWVNRLKHTSSFSQELYPLHSMTRAGGELARETDSLPNCLKTRPRAGRSNTSSP